jgi:hypothetical protein
MKSGKGTRDDSKQTDSRQILAAGCALLNDEKDQTDQTDQID